MKENNLDSSASLLDNEQRSPEGSHANNEVEPASRTISKSHITLSLAALFIAIASAITGIWLWLQIYHDIDEVENNTLILSKRIEALNFESEIKKLIGKLEAEKTTLSNKIAEQHELLETLQQSVIKLFSNMSQTPREWTIAQSLYLARLANHRLKFTRDIDAAIVALQAVDKILEESGDPSLLQARKVISTDLEKLNNYKQPNLIVIKEKLNSLLKELRFIPLAKPDTSKGQKVKLKETGDSLNSERDAENMFHALLKEINRHLVVKRHDIPVDALPSQQSQIFYYQILHLKLESIRLSILREDNNEYQKQIKSTLNWIDSHYTPSSAKELKEELEKLIIIDIAPPLPEISESIEALKIMLDTAMLHVEEGTNE